ncbi:MAG: ATP-dependent helicase [Thermoguttaceae bacterium]
MGDPLLRLGLTDAQQAAILHTEGPLLIVAGPGAGKTEVIVRRTARLVLEAGVQPRNILVTTFTNKAADELYDRLWPSLGKAVYDLHISTIHSFCQMLLGEYPDAHPWGRRFEVLDDRRQFLLVYARLGELGLNRFPKARLGDFLADVIATFNLCTEEMVEPARFRQAAEQRGAELLGLKKASPEAVEEYLAVAEAYARYLELLRGEALLDFGMLQRVAYEMLQKEAIRAQVADRFRYILVDEYQDTNRLQVLLLKQIATPRFNICAVGDDDQSIYRFRGATVSSFLNFEEDFPGARTVFLDTNFRATPELVEAASALIAHNAPYRKAKNLRAQRPPRSPARRSTGQHVCGRSRGSRQTRG